MKKPVLVAAGAGILGSRATAHIEVTISALAQLVSSLVSSRSRLGLRLLPQDDPRQRCPDITRARQFLCWSPKVQPGEGLSRTVSYFDSLLSSSSQARKLVLKAAV